MTLHSLTHWQRAIHTWWQHLTGIARQSPAALAVAGVTLLLLLGEPLLCILHCDVMAPQMPARQTSAMLQHAVEQATGRSFHFTGAGSGLCAFADGSDQMPQVLIPAPVHELVFQMPMLLVTLLLGAVILLPNIECLRSCHRRVLVPPPIVA